MRVALIDPSLFTWPYDNELALALSSNGNDAKIFGKVLTSRELQFSNPLLDQHFYSIMATPIWEHAPKTLYRAAKGLSHVKSMGTLISSLKKWSPDVIHFHWLPLPIVDRYFLPVLRCIAPIVLTVHDTLPFNGAPGSSLQTVGALKALSCFDNLIVHTEQGMERVSLHVGGSERISQIPHGLLHQDPTSPPIQRAACGPNGEITFLLFGKIKPYKGIDVLIEALALLTPSARTKCRVQIVGQPYMGTGLLTGRAAELGVSEMIDFQFRFVSDKELVGLMDKASMLLFPYREIEASGVLMSGINRGRPVIASRLGSFNELLENDQQGLLIPPGDSKALAVAMERVIADPELVSRLGAGMEALRSSIPSWGDIAHRTVDVYRAAQRHWHRAAHATEDDMATTGRPAVITKR